MPESDIKPSGMRQGDFVDLLYMLVSSIAGICTKLDSDGTVPLTTYLANCYTAIFTVGIRDQRNNDTGIATEYSIKPYGVGDPAVLTLMYQIFNAWETLTEQLDTDVLTDSDYEELCYTDLYLHLVENQQGEILGNSNAFTFKSGGVGNQLEMVEWLYNAVNAVETLTEKLDADATPTDTDYEALWFTANITLVVENGQGQQVGNN